MNGESSDKILNELKVRRFSDSRVTWKTFLPN